jgi:hypothetical protein
VLAVIRASFASFFGELGNQAELPIDLSNESQLPIREVGGDPFFYQGRFHRLVAQRFKNVKRTSMILFQ